MKIKCKELKLRIRSLKIEILSFLILVFGIKSIKLVIINNNL